MKIPMSDAPQVQADKQDPLTFAKMAGAGNDFVVIDNREGIVADAVALTRRICTRALSVGADGLILIENSSRATFRIRYYNADGSLGEFCGNGTRCAARFAFLSAIAGRKMTIETDAGIVDAELIDDSTVSISIPQPRAFRSLPLRAGESVVNGFAIVVGVPHYVVVLPGELWEQEIVALGRAIRNHPEMQPDGANVNFVVVRDMSSIEVRTYERGVEAETLACGSGVVASVAVATLIGKVRPPAAVLTRSGVTLEVAMRNESGELRDVRLRGDARLIYRTALTPETITGFDPDFVRDPARAEAKVLT
jgi:diaminopimelate epimerase